MKTHPLAVSIAAAIVVFVVAAALLVWEEELAGGLQFWQDRLDAVAERLNGWAARLST